MSILDNDGGWEQGRFNQKKLARAVNDYVEYCCSSEHNPDTESKYTNDVFEAAIELFRGPEIWDKITEKQLEA